MFLVCRCDILGALCCGQRAGSAESVGPVFSNVVKSHNAHKHHVLYYHRTACHLQKISYKVQSIVGSCYLPVVIYIMVSV